MKTLEMLWSDSLPITDPYPFYKHGYFYPLPHLRNVTCFAQVLTSEEINVNIYAYMQTDIRTKPNLSASSIHKALLSQTITEDTFMGHAREKNSIPQGYKTLNKTAMPM